MKYIFNIITVSLLLLIVFMIGRKSVYVKVDGSQSLLDTGLRQSCLDCVRKHISQSIVLLNEASLGYPNHRWLAIGHLAEAESESIKDYPELAKTIRLDRERIIAGESDIDLLNLIELVNRFANK